MSIPNFPSTGLVPNVTTFQVGDILYMWDGEKWKSITAPLKADQITWKDGKTAGYALDDLDGFTEELYAQAGIVDDGLPDNVGTSKRVVAITNICGRQFENINEMLSSNHLVNGARYTTGGTTWEYMGGGANILNFKPISAIYAADFSEFSGEDVTSALLSISSVCSDNTIIFPFGGEGYLTESVRFNTPKSINFNGLLLTINKSTNVYDSRGVILIGSHDVTLLHTLSAELTQTTRNLGSFTGVSRGDWISIYNPVDGSWNLARPQYRQGEYCKVVEVTPSVVVAGGIMDTYPSGCEIYLLDYSERIKISGEIKITNVGSKITQCGLSVANTFELDITQLSVIVNELTSACTLTRCGNISGTGVNFEEHAGAPYALDYGLVYDGCQHSNLEGSWYAQRHGCTSGSSNVSAISVNRYLYNKGRIKTSGKGLVQAADYHGNTEYSGYGGEIDGLTVGGHASYTTPGTKIYGVTGVDAVVNYPEIKSTQHTLVGDIYDNGDHTLRGTIDIGGNSTHMGDFTVIGGVFDFSKVRLHAPNQTGLLISLRNRGAFIDYSVNLAGMIVDAPLATSLIVGTRVTGDQIKNVMFSEVDSIWTKGISIATSTRIHGIRLLGKSSVSTLTSEFLSTEDIVFPYQLPRAPLVHTSRKGAYSGVGTYPICNPNAVTRNGFTINFATADGGNFSSAVSHEVYWSAECI